MASEADVLAVAPSFRLAWKDSRPRVNVDYIRQRGDGVCTYWVKLKERDAALAVIDGVPTTVTISTSPLVEVTRNIPLVHPFESNLIASGYEEEIFFSGAPEDPAVWNSGHMVKLTVRFYLPEYNLNGDTPYQKVSARGFLREDPVDGVTFASGGTPGFDATELLPGMSYLLTVFDAPDVTTTQENLWRSLQGLVNSSAFRGNPAETVQFANCSFDYTRKRDGTQTCTYTVQLDVLSRSWNSMRKRTGALDTLYVNAAKRYTPVDFNQLFA